jgi:predicted RNase H-related nuclease YkuK (DUF458 family)
MSKCARSDEPMVNQVQMKSQDQMTKLIKEEISDMEPFVIHLTFGPASAGLTFELFGSTFEYIRGKLER